MVSLGDLVPAPYNPRRMTPAEEKHLTESVRSFGLVDPLIVNRHPKRANVVIGGHQRLRIARKLGINSVPVVYVALDEARERELNLRLNKNLGEWDFDLLAQFERGLLERVGFDEKELAKLFPAEIVEDEAPPLPAEPVTRPGDLYTLGDHRLLCGDATKREDVARLMRGEKAVIMNTDPPYGVNYADVANSRDIKARNRIERIENDDLSGVALQEFLESSIRAALPHFIENPAFYLWHPMLTQGTFFAAAAAAADILIHRQIVWIKPSLILGRGDYHWRHELCFYGWIRGKRCAWLSGRDQDTVWQIGRESTGAHPTQKPVELFMRPIINHTRIGDVVFEPFAGSGPQFVAAETSHRRCFGLEIDPRYCDVIVARWEKLTGRKAEHARG